MKLSHNTEMEYRRQELERQEALRNAEAHRQAHDINEKGTKTPFYAPVLANIGEKLVNTGRNLQERYGELAEQPKPIRRAELI